MNFSNESLLTILLVGLVAGWLAGRIIRGGGFGLIGNIILGILGALVASWLLPRIGIRLGAGMVSAVVNATIGAVVLLFIAGLLSGGNKAWGNRWRIGRW
jgi:uncharacterized membrane protein YeaQ/YmgE (transglycosylase-associated protein family)